MVYHEKDRQQDRGQPIKCHVCGELGGTLKKDDKGYHHIDLGTCSIMQQRRARIKN